MPDDTEREVLDRMMAVTGITDAEIAGLTAADDRARVPGEVGDEQSVDLTPGVVWTDSQLVVVRDLTSRAFRAEEKRAALVEALEGLAAELRQEAERMAGFDDPYAAGLGAAVEAIRAVLEAHR